MYNTAIQNKKRLGCLKSESIINNISSSSQQDTEEEKFSKYLNRKDTKQPKDSVYSENILSVNSNFSQESSSDLDKRFNMIKLGKSIEGSDNEDFINSSENKYGNDIENGTNYKNRNQFSTDSYNFAFSQNTNQNSSAAYKQHIESSHENTKNLDIKLKNAYSSFGTSNEVSSNEKSIIKDGKTINNYQNYRNENNKNLKYIYQNTSYTKKYSQLPSGVIRPNRSDWLNKYPEFVSDTQHQISNINENSSHIKDDQNIKDGDENYNSEELEEKTVHVEYQNKISDKTKIILEKLKRSRTPIGRNIESPPMEESKDNTSNEKEINATTSTNKEKPEEDKNNERVKVEIDRENNRLIANIQVIKDSSAKYDNIFNYLLCRIKDSSSIYVDINMENEVCYTDNIMDCNSNNESEDNDYCVKEITFCNNSSSSATPEIMELIQRIVYKIKSTELIISKFSFTDLQDIMKRVKDRKINLSFLRIEEIDKFDEKLFFSNDISSIKCISIYNNDGTSKMINEDEIKYRKMSNAGEGDMHSTKPPIGKYISFKR